MSWTLILICLILGILLFTLEIVALPGMISGIMGLGLMALGIWQTYLQKGTSVGNTVLLICIAACIILIIIMLKNRTWRKFSLKEESASTVNQVDQQTIVKGAKGVTISRLAPTGKALFDGQQVEVHAVNAYIEPNTPIEVVAVEGYRIDVCQINDERF